MAFDDISFGRAESGREIDDIGAFIDRYAGGYDFERHQTWNRTRNLPGVVSGHRIGFGFWLQRELSGGMILKPLEGETDHLELKYFRVAAPDFSGRGAGGFMMRQLPHLGQATLEHGGLLSTDANTFSVTLDTRAGGPAQSFFAHFGFRVVDTVPLYDVAIPDVVMERTYPLH